MQRNKATPNWGLCSACDQRFSTQSGLGQHKRHRHPVLRNEKRLKSAPKVKGKPGRSDRIWSQEEVALLRELEKTNRRQLAREILGAPTSSSCPLSKEELETCFREKLSAPNKNSNINKYASYTGKVDDWTLMKPIEVEEVEAAIKGIDENSATGPDGLKLQDLRTIHEQEETHLPRLFSLWLKSSTIPDSLKKSWTVLIPKCEDKDRLKSIDNWQPVTIDPMLLRLFTKIMAKHQSETVEINPRQKGFLAATPGCNENIVILENIIKGAKHNHKDLTVVFVDLAKAFDSVGLKLLIKSLQRVKLPEAFVHLIEELYTGNTTVVEGNGNLITPINIQRGVKQGDPLSPILFNIALDPLVCSLERANSGVSMPLGGKRVNCSTLTFTDDIVLSNSYTCMARNLKLLQAHCDHTGLSINPAKTKGFHFTFKRKTFLHNHFTNWKLRDESIAYIPPCDTEKYLGACINPWAGVAEGEWEEKHKSWVKGMQAAPLRPRQRLEILKIHVIPRPYFHLILTEASQATLIKLDQIIHNTTKEFLHLPTHTADGVLYASNRNSGLGVPKLEVQIPSTIVRKCEALEMSSDVVIRASFQYKGESVAGL
ncbi:hypothetical protein chiPu_0004938 [Chiloscyllium punctatum]|uniref:Reverse transcriptase domain-containing protein n=1 Tax=Chiloscyllium punctatum TaxID=137246 RepID=A0A401S810_CHIPU|nr:hypothetical protein [Chiloscyllium punctatum]